MCGIAAIAGDRDSARVSAALCRMVRSMNHRGPDGNGVWAPQTPAGVGLGNCRLAIQDLSPMGAMPMHNSDTGDVITFNGEIYNAPELREQLTSFGLAFRGHSDTEVVLRAYQKWGRGCLDRFRGMFAFAIWDAGRRRLFVARDCIGIKPLYYACSPASGFVCASETRAICVSGLVGSELNRSALGSFLAYGSVQEPFTIYENIQSLAPGSWLEISQTGEIADKGRFWDFPAVEEEMRRRSTADVVEEGSSILRAAVKRHLLSDARLGIFLSSGLDSTAVLAFTREVLASGNVDAFTVSFPDQPSCDEARVASETARRLNVQHHVHPVSNAQSLIWAHKALQSIDQPAMDGLNTYIVARALREEGIVVALSGLGGDEMFGGYPSYRSVPSSYRWLTFGRLLGAGIRRELARLAGFGLNRVRGNKLRDMAITGASLSGQYFQYRRLLSSCDLAALGFDAGSLQLTRDYQDPRENAAKYESRDLTASVVRLETAYYLRNTLLRDADVFGMANSLEIRVPFLDRDVVEWACRLPGDVLLPPGQPPKFLLRGICKSHFSLEQIVARKRGFTLPFSSWLLGPLRDLSHDCTENLVRNLGLKRQPLEQFYQVLREEPHSAAWSRVWALVVLGFWLRSRKSDTATGLEAAPAAS